MNLVKYQKNIFSQNGEDGVIEEILNRLGKNSDKSSCEFGAWDGIHLSNCYNLILSKSFKGLFIEGDKKKFIDLKKNLETKNTILVNKYVTCEGPNSLDNILESNNFNIDFDFLSIDIDGNDYHIFESLIKFKPKIIVIEFNPTIPNDVEFIQEKNDKINQGSSALSILKLAKKKGYNLICATHCNLFFVEETFKQVIIGNNFFSINDFVDDTKHKNYIFYGFDGTIFTSKKIALPKHNNLSPKINQIPKIFRGIPSEFSVLKKIFFACYLFYHNPIKYLSNPKKYLKLIFQ